MTGTAEPELPDTGGVAVVLAHAAWADGSSWNKVIAGLRSEGVKAVAVPLPLTTLADDVAALDQTLERVEGPVVVAGHAYAGAVIASTRDEKVASLVYVTALAPDEGETVGDVYYWAEHHPQAPALGPDRHGLIWLPQEAFSRAFAQHATPLEQALLGGADEGADPHRGRRPRAHDHQSPGHRRHPAGSGARGRVEPEEGELTWLTSPTARRTWLA
jgi:alpha/beta hydrolase family protein